KHGSQRWNSRSLNCGVPDESTHSSVAEIFDCFAISGKVDSTAAYRAQLLMSVGQEGAAVLGNDIDFENRWLRLQLAEKHRNREFILPTSRLHDIETKAVVPSIFRLYTLSWVYGRKIGVCCGGTDSVALIFTFSLVSAEQ